MSGVMQKLGSGSYWDITRILRRAFQKHIIQEQDITQEEINQIINAFDVEFKICKYRLERLEQDFRDFKLWSNYKNTM